MLNGHAFMPRSFIFYFQVKFKLKINKNKAGTKAAIVDGCDVDGGDVQKQVSNNAFIYLFLYAILCV